MSPLHRRISANGLGELRTYALPTWRRVLARLFVEELENRLAPGSLLRGTAEIPMFEASAECETRAALAITERVSFISDVPEDLILAALVERYHGDPPGGNSPSAQREINTPQGKEANGPRKQSAPQGRLRSKVHEVGLSAFLPLSDDFGTDSKDLMADDADDLDDGGGNSPTIRPVQSDSFFASVAPLGAVPTAETLQLGANISSQHVATTDSLSILPSPEPVTPKPGQGMPAPMAVVVTNLPKAESILTGADTTYIGSFRVPEINPGTAATFSYAGGVGDTTIAVAYNPANNSLFMAGTIAGYFRSWVAEISIPTAMNSPNLSKLPVANFVQPFGNLTQGLQNQVGDQGNTRPILGGLAIDGNTAYWSAYGYYDGAGAISLALGKSKTTLDSPQAQGMFALSAPDTPAGAEAGWISPIPKNWQSQFGGDTYYSGLGAVSVVSRSSFGTAMVAFNPSQLGTEPAPARSYIYYDQRDPMLGYNWGIYKVAPRGSAFIDTGNKVGIVYAGYVPVGQSWYGGWQDGPGGASDPIDHTKGGHSSGGIAPVWWIYDPRAVAANVNGGGHPWSLQPGEYRFGGTVSDNPFFANNIGATVNGMTYDPASRRLYVVSANADQQGFDYYPLVHVYQVQS